MDKAAMVSPEYEMKIIVGAEEAARIVDGYKKAGGLVQEWVAADGKWVKLVHDGEGRYRYVGNYGRTYICQIILGGEMEEDEAINFMEEVVVEELGRRSEELGQEVIEVKKKGNSKSNSNNNTTTIKKGGSTMGKDKTVKEEKAVKTPIKKEAVKVKAAGTVEAPKPEKKAPRNCPECGIPNDAMRLTCEVCGTAMYADVKKRIYDDNKRLKAAIKTGDAKRVKELRARIKETVKDSDGAYAIDEAGFGMQVKSVEPKKAKGEGSGTGGAPKVKKEGTAPREKKEARKCVCCDQMTSGGFFAMGHDSRVKSMFKKIEKGELKEKEAIGENSRLKAMFKMWKEKKGGEGGTTIKECAAATEGK